MEILFRVRDDDFWAGVGLITSVSGSMWTSVVSSASAGNMILVVSALIGESFALNANSNFFHGASLLFFDFAGEDGRPGEVDMGDFRSDPLVLAQNQYQTKTKGGMLNSQYGLGC